MTTLTVTKDFLDVFFVNSDKDEYHKDLFRFFKDEIFGVRLICDFSSIDEFKSALIENPYWEILMDKYDDVNFHPRLNEELSKNTFYEKLNEVNIFFSSLSINDCQRLSKERGYIYISSEDISISWKPIKFIRDNGLLKVTNDPKFPTTIKFDTWDKIDKYCIPSTSVLIFDKYIFSDSKNQRLTDNLFKMLKKICLNSLVKPLTLSIISEFDTDHQIINAYKKIDAYFNENGINNITFNILKHDKGKYPLDFEGLHYRLILTNNLRIKCDDSFNFFKKNGKINNDADIHISLHMCQPLKCFYDKELNHIKRYVSKLDNLSSETQLVNKIYCYPNKYNYLL
jgi:hypothetical protein